jgi:hypothetical protein
MTYEGDVIYLREPAETWKANLFWGLLFGLLLIVPSFFAPEYTPLWKKYGLMILGVAWLGFMCRKAFQNRGRRVRCDWSEIEVSQPSGSWRIPLSEVKRAVRMDIREDLRKWNDMGRPRYKTKPLNTLSSMVVYTLYDGSDRELLRLDKKMEPAGEMRRFLERMEEVTGCPIHE